MARDIIIFLADDLNLMAMIRPLKLCLIIVMFSYRIALKLEIILLNQKTYGSFE